MASFSQYSIKERKIIPQATNILPLMPYWPVADQVPTLGPITGRKEWDCDCWVRPIIVFPTGPGLIPSQTNVTARKKEVAL